MRNQCRSSKVLKENKERSSLTGSNVWGITSLKTRHALISLMSANSSSLPCRLLFTMVGNVSNLWEISYKWAMPRVLDNTSIDFPGGTRTRELPVARLIGLRSLRKFDLLGVGERLRESILFFINRGKSKIQSDLRSQACALGSVGL